MNEFEQLYSVLQSQVSAGSGTGGSYWAISATCGMKGRLYEHYKVGEKVEYRADAKTPSGKDKVTGKFAGAFYHSLQQYWRTGRFDVPTALSVSHGDPNYAAAAHAFQHYRRRFKNDRHNRCQVIDAEVKTPGNQAQVELLRAALGDVPFTIRHDLRGYVDSARVQQYLEEDGILLPGPGNYLVDYKLVQSITGELLDGYRYGFQGLSYPVVYNICHPDDPVLGTLFDVMARVKDPQPQHFAVVLAEPGPEALSIVRHGLDYAKRLHDEGAANPIMCDKTAFGACRLMTNGQCPRYGTYNDFNWGENLGEWSPK